MLLRRITIVQTVYDKISSSPHFDTSENDHLYGSPCNTKDVGSIPESGRSPGGENGNPLQYSCLKNPMDKEAWRATVQRVAKSQTQLSMHALIECHSIGRKYKQKGPGLMCLSYHILSFQRINAYVKTKN